ncbi:FitA-like ribbon-helix-helix domain-containing protein [Kushneria aurantia]|uniref:Arc family DNA-binding protein n=1 Tax=Kushneria aurantia TaxID=504092 RepID=A0ABV6G291_9GAMM|nr:Arc family DNA-binding protein [Kushneria aurantia]
MGMMTIRSIPDEVHNALKARARRHHRSAEAEVRAILEEAIRPESRLRMGDALAELGRKVGLTNEDFAALEQVRDRTPAEPMRFE